MKTYTCHFTDLRTVIILSSLIDPKNFEFETDAIKKNFHGFYSRFMMVFSTLARARGYDKFFQRTRDVENSWTFNHSKYKKCALIQKEIVFGGAFLNEDLSSLTQSEIEFLYEFVGKTIIGNSVISNRKFTDHFFDNITKKCHHPDWKFGFLNMDKNYPKIHFKDGVLEL